jgi:ankyrin repeat protein
METPGVDTSAKDVVYDQTPLQLAAQWGTVDVVQYMMENRAHTESEPYSLLHLAAYGGKLNIAKYLVCRKYDQSIRDRDGKIPLHSACKSGQLEVVKYFVGDCKCDIASNDNRYHETPLDMAAKYGKMDIVGYLVEEKNFVIDEEVNRNTALHHAAWGGAMDVVKYFIETRKWSPSLRGKNGRTPIHSACLGGRRDIVDYLITQYNLDPSIRDDMGFTPLHLAAREGHLSLVEKLVHKFRCDHSIKNHIGKTPSDYARDRNHPTIVEYLSHIHEIISDEWRKHLKEKLTCLIKSCRPTGEELGSGAYSTVIELMLNGISVAGKVFKHFKSSGMKQEHQAKLRNQYNGWTKSSQYYSL